MKPGLLITALRKYIIIFILFCSTFSFAQSVYAPLDNDYYNLIDRFDILGYSGNIFTSVKPYQRKDIAALVDSLSKDTSSRFSKVDRRNMKYLQDDNWEWSHSKDSGNSKHRFMLGLYKKRNDFYEVYKKDFQFQLNPVAYFSYGKDDTTTKKTTYINTRGFELRGIIDNKVGFYTFLTDNQAVFPQYVDTRIASTNAIPGEGFWEPFKVTGYDFYTVKGYIDFNLTKHISTQFGQDDNFIGDGYRSLMLSNYSGNYLFWKVDTKIWKLEYVNIFAQMTADIIDNPGYPPVPTGDVAYPHKYMALHYFTLNLGKKFNVGLFECITFGNTDTIHNRGFDFNYFNPVIFYNAVENGLGAPDKDHIGVCFKWNIAHHVSLYGTIFLDEFNIDEIRAGNGWWGNKQAAQFGLKDIDLFGIHNLDLQLEANVVPPYTYETYSFSSTANYSYFANYSNYMQPLADPNGANFDEAIAILKCQPFYKFSFSGKIFGTLIGLDPPGMNYGSNIMLSNTTRVSDFGNKIAQGEETGIIFLSFTATYQLTHNMFIDFTAIDRYEKSKLITYDSDDKSVAVSFRWNIAKRLQEF
ncbi:MAG: hypothetical protein ACLQQ4_19225 [Bacteroidia bacterium]